ncbi:YT521-B-like domain [Ancistrocladus abbreviatus]
MNPHLSTMLLDHIETINNDGAREFVVEPGVYFPTGTNYAYYCTGIESPSDWDDHHRVFGLDGGDIQYVGAQTESLPYLYYTPSYGYGESPYNPYNPFISGAMIGVDGSYVGTQPYHTVPSYQNSVSSPGYFPIVQSGPDVVGSSSSDSLFDTGHSAANRAVSSGARESLSSAAFSQNSRKAASNLTHAVIRMAEGSRVNCGSNKYPTTHRCGASASLPHGASSVLPQGGNGPVSHLDKDDFSHGKVLPPQNQLKVSLPVGGLLSDSSANGHDLVDGLWSKFYYRRTSSNANGNSDLLGEQNRGPRTSRSKNQFIVKAYTTKAGEANSQGIIVISSDQYNRDDLLVDYTNGKFFVIKSYSEDDVHKSIKYNVWSSTPNGNKKLNIAYEDAEKIGCGRPGGCPIFLFFSVNASGQFCGVAEMVGGVDFCNDMDFWQQDKWSGSFPVKWHIIKDVPNTNFRHIILENNEHKPVTNSRDTQEIPYRQGMEMLKIFKNYMSKTSLLDDFMYYEHRQKIMWEDRARFLPKSSTLPFGPFGKITCLADLPLKEGEKISHCLSGSEKMTESATEKVPLNDEGDKSSTIAKQNGVEVNGDVGVSALKIGSLTIKPKQTEFKYSQAPPSSVKGSGQGDIVTVGSMPVKVNGFDKPPAPFTVGTIPLDPKALEPKMVGVLPK